MEQLQPAARDHVEPLKVAFLVGADSPSTRLSIEAVCRVPAVIPVTVLLDTYQSPLRVRWKNVRRIVRREGIGHLYRVAVRLLREWLDARAARIIPRAEVDALLRAAFPERSFSLSDLAARYGFRVHECGNLNSPAAAERLRDSGASLGIVVGTRVLKRSTFAVPKLGCINLHKGKVPDFRGMPPAFWELYEGAESAGVTVHFVDDGLDTGAIITASEIPIHPKETVASLRTKLDHRGALVLAESVAALQTHSAKPVPQPAGGPKARTKPTRAQELELAQRAEHLRQLESDWKRIVKTAAFLAFLELGVYRLVRKYRHAPNGRGAVILHHRVNDISDDNLTTSTRVFAEHLLMLKKYYSVSPTSAIVEAVCGRHPIQPGTVTIHFDDCYRDVAQEAAPLLKAAGLPASMFIATGFIDTDRVFEHDRLNYPHNFENLCHTDIPRLLEGGFEIGAHTVNHVDLGVIDAASAWREVIESKETLEKLSGRPVTTFSFPFGKETNMRAEIRDMVARAGFRAMFSAHGGFVSGDSNPYDIPRLGANSRYRALDLMMEIEALSLPQLFSRIRRGR